jgi:hypothetical protein
MGVVYLAADSSDRQVAVKALRFGAAGDLTAKRRLAREVETMRRVHSPYVAEIIDADVEGTPPYIVTRYVPGSTLDEVVSRQGPLAGQSLVRLAHGLAAALTAVHSAGVVHRDLKPGNVMLVDGDPIVIDFGIAQVPDATRITMTGMFMGTPGYLAPEVIEGRPSGPAADVHSWGATVAFAATGRPPFGTGSFEAIFYQIVHGQPDLAGVPAPLLQLVVRALARDPARRPAATELVSCTAGLDLSAWLPGAPGTAVPAAGLLPAATAADVQVRRAAGLPAVNGAPVPPGIALPGTVPPGTVSPGTVSPGTRPMAVGAPTDFRDLLPPVSYRQPVPFAPAPAMAPAGTPAAAVAGPAALAQPGTGQPAAGTPAAARPQRSARGPLAVAAIAIAVAASVLFPVAGSAAALAGLIALRAADLTSRSLARRRSRAGRRPSDPLVAAVRLPVALCHALLSTALLLPLALIAATAAGVITLVVAPGSSLARAGAYAAGAMVACYGLGPGSGASRRPLSRFFAVTAGSPVTAAVAFVGLAALAVALFTAASSLAPFYWPATHLSLLFRNLPLVSTLIRDAHAGLLTRIGRFGL